MTKLYAPREFAKKIKVSRATIYRWMATKRFNKYFKMYDAAIVTVAGKKFIEVTNQNNK